MAHIFFDFDSTIVTKESLDEVLVKALENHPDKEHLSQEIEDITNRGMNGEFDFKTSIEKRLAIADLHQDLFEAVGQELLHTITPGIENLIQKLQLAKHQVYIISGGFLPCILPTASKLKIPAKNCFANEAIFNEKGQMVGLDQTNLMWTNKGKFPVINFLKKDRQIKQKTVMIGDGSNDLKAFEHQIVDIFCGFGVNVIRESVKAKAPNFFTQVEDLADFLKVS